MLVLVPLLLGDDIVLVVLVEDPRDPKYRANLYHHRKFHIAVCNDQQQLLEIPEFFLYMLVTTSIILNLVRARF